MAKTATLAIVADSHVLANGQMPSDVVGHTPSNTKSKEQRTYPDVAE